MPSRVINEPLTVCPSLKSASFATSSSTGTPCGLQGHTKTSRVSNIELDLFTWSGCRFKRKVKKSAARTPRMKWLVFAQIPFGCTATDFCQGDGPGSGRPSSASTLAAIVVNTLQVNVLIASVHDIWSFDWFSFVKLGRITAGPISSPCPSPSFFLLLPSASYLPSICLQATPHAWERAGVEPSAWTKWKRRGNLGSQ